MIKEKLRNKKGVKAVGKDMQLDEHAAEIFEVHDIAHGDEFMAV